MMNSEKNAEIIRNIINHMENSPDKPSSITESDIRKKISTIDKSEVVKKLNSMGLSGAAKMLLGMSDEDIIREIGKNPSILKKLNSLLK